MNFKTRPSLLNQYYVYSHIDPETKDVLYVGRGYGPRAYTTNSNVGNSRGDRSPEHSLHLHQLMNLGYLPHEWVVFLSRNLSKQSSVDLEKKYIENFNPKFNNKLGPKNIEFTVEQLKEISDMRENKMSYEDIGKSFDCSRSTIHRLFNTRKG